MSAQCEVAGRRAAGSRLGFFERYLTLRAVACIATGGAVRHPDPSAAGLILLAAALCIAMVFVWSRLTDGEPNFTLAQVALNDTIMVFAFAPIVGLLLGLSALTVPWGTLLLSVTLYIVLPVAAAQAWRGQVFRHRGGAGGPRDTRRPPLTPT